MLTAKYGDLPDANSSTAGANPMQRPVRPDANRQGDAHAPKRIEFVESLPLTAVGKIDKKALRSGYWAAPGRLGGGRGGGRRLLSQEARGRIGSGI